MNGPNRADNGLDAAAYAHRIAEALHRKVWQHAPQGAIEHMRTVLEVEIDNVIFQTVRAIARNNQEQP